MRHRHHHRRPGSEPAPDGPAVTATAIELIGNRGRVYGPCTFTVPAGRLTVVRGPSGSGRTTLLLTLTGRMRPTCGDVTILGHPYPQQGRAIRARTAVAGFAGIDDLDEAVTVGEAVRERDCWLAPWYARVPRADAARVEQVCGPLFGDRPHPSPGTVAWELGELDGLLLRVALALVPGPDLLAVDHLDQVSDPAQRRFLLGRLRAVADTGTTVLAAAVDTAGPVDDAHQLHTLADPED